MEIGLFGLPRSGKTTLFHALTGGAHESSGGDAHLAVINVPDPRFDRLLEVYEPRKVVPATVRALDLAGVAAGEGKGLTPQILARIGTTDALCTVIRAFDDGSGIDPDPEGDLENLLLEMTLSDLTKIENRLERIRKGVNRLSGDERKNAEKELAVLERIHPDVEAGKAIRDLALTDDEEPMVRGFQFLSLKPLLAVLNIGEDVAADPLIEKIKGHLGEGTEVIAINAEIENEIAQLDTDEDRQTFMEDFGLTEPARDRLIQRLHSVLGLITFFTVSEKEVHAWNIGVNTPAQQAAGAIHSDLERGFIRAEVIHVDEFHANGSSLTEAKKCGKLRMEGKSYLVQDGEIFHVLFNV